SSDFIIGFPGETDADFEDTMDLIREIGFDHSFSFIYSPRPGTPAAQLPDDVSPEVKKARLQVVQETIDMQGRAISAAMVGTTQKVLVLGHSDKNPEELRGRTENNRIVSFKGLNIDLVGQIVTVKVTEVYRNSLCGELQV
ncbi:MAG TPA: TRAM domain-containing protein, partial [Gammaproteobacteria bacterium]|nr:TRAM domain-containing protein [Gammaproteobacteria bacterium]